MLVALGKRDLIGRVGPAQRLDEQEPQRCGLSFDGARRKLAVAKQMDLVLANAIRAELVWRTVEALGESFQSMHVGANSVWGVVTALELIQHPLAKMGHRKILLVTQTLTAQLSTCHRCSSRRASGFVQTLFWRLTVLNGGLPRIVQ